MLVCEVDKYTAGAWVIACVFVFLLFMLYNKESKVMITLPIIFSAPVIMATFVGTIWCAIEYCSPDTPPQIWTEEELQRCTRNRLMSRTLSEPRVVFRAAFTRNVEGKVTGFLLWQPVILHEPLFSQCLASMHAILQELLLQSRYI